MIHARYFLYGFYVTALLVAHGSNCSLDPSFGTSGITTSSVDRDDILYLSMVQTDSSIVTTGSTSTAAVTRLAVARYTADGLLDTTFNTTGVNAVLIGSRSEGRGIAIQSDDKIIASGYAIQSQVDLLLARYTTAGVLDTSFNGAGFVTTSTGIGAVAQSVLVRQNGTIAVGGTCINSSFQSQFLIAQYTSAGNLDTFFGASDTGITVTSIGSHAAIAHIALQSDNKIVAAGWTLHDNVNKFALARYELGGSLDTTFGSSGIVVTSIGTDAHIHAMALQSDGKIVVAGQAIVSGVRQFVVARYDTDGSLDTSFNGSGVVLTNIQDYSIANAVVIQTDGKIVAGGMSIGDDATQFALARYSSTGILDSGFGTNGIQLTTIPSGSSNTFSVLNSLTVSEYILAVGSSDRDFALAAYTI